MASTYSTNLKLQLMTTGENTGTWGNVTNVNLGTALEESIVGTGTVTFSGADETLLLTNTNASQTARNIRLVLSGTSNGVRQLVVPAVEKVYIVKNDLADACTVLVSGQTGVSVPSGKTMWLYNNGTDVTDVTTYLSNLSLGSPLPVSSGGTGSNIGPNVSTVTGVLPIANGGTGSNTGVNVTTVSGVLPVLNGGTGSNIGSFSGANITSLNATNISTGELVVSRGGTGANSLTANSVILGNGTSSVLFVSPGTSGNVLSSNGTTWVSTSTGVIVSGTSITLSGTQADFTGLPSGIKRITIMVHNMSLSGTGVPILRIGAGSIITSGYLSAQNSQPSAADPNGLSNQTGFLLNNSGVNTNFISGTGVLTKLSDFIYTYSSNWGIVGGTQQFIRTMLCNGSIDAGSAVDSIRLTSTNGSDVFDSGNFNIMYEI
jgi:hypothetical protein